MGKKNYRAILDYTNYEDLLKKAGYFEKKPKVGVLGKALAEASKNHRSIKWLKNHLDTYFNKLRQEKKDKGKNEKN